MTFKEMLADDIHDVFLDPEEFGETHTINEKEMVIVIDNVGVNERDRNQSSNAPGIGSSQASRTEGYHRKQTLFYVARSDFGRLPGIGSAIKFDGASYVVENAVSEGGIYAITIGRNKG